MAMSKNVLDIPPEILQRIFSYGTLEDKLKVRLTCTTFREQASHPRVLSLHMMDRKYSLQEFSTLTQSMKQLMPNIVALRLTDDHSDFVSEEFLDSLLDNCSRLETLCMERCRVRSGACIAQLLYRLSTLILTDVIFDQTPESFFKVTGSRMMELLPRLPNLTKLDLKGCIISDLGFQAITETLHGLKMLSLKNTMITNDGLVSNLPRFTALQKVVIGSVNVNEGGVLPIIDFLSTIPIINLKFRQGRLGVNRTHGLNALEYRNFSSPAFVTRILPAFLDATTVNLSDITLTVADMECIDNCHPNMEALFLDASRATDDVIQAILSRFSRLKTLHMSNTCVTDATFLKLVDRRDETSLREVSFIENENFPSDDTIVTVAPTLCAMKYFNISDDLYNNQIILERQVNCNSLQLSGSCITDSVLLAFVSGVKGLSELIISQTSVTLAGLRKVAPFLTGLEELELNVSTEIDVQHFSGDDAASVLGELVMSNLKELSIKGKSFTDAGLAKLVPHFDTLKRLQVIQSSITLDCIKGMGPQLGKISEVVFRGHLHLRNAVAGDHIHFLDEDEEDFDEEDLDDVYFDEEYLDDVDFDEEYLDDVDFDEDDEDFIEEDEDELEEV